MEKLLCSFCGLKPRWRHSDKCQSCKKNYDKAYFQQHVQEKTESAVKRKRDLVDWFRALKAKRPCQRCGGQFDPVCMDFDHVPGRGRKFMEVSKMVRLGYEKEKILAEIAKCQSLCANCHRLLTHERRISGGGAKRLEGNAIV